MEITNKLPEIETTANISVEEFEAIKEMSEEVLYPSWFGFLNEHNSWRQGKVHSILGEKGGGKSTFMRSIIVDLLLHENDADILLWLSEDSREDFLSDFSRVIPSEGFPEGVLDKLDIVSEVDLRANGYTKEQCGECFKNYVIHSGKNFVIYDNLTTSMFYDSKRPDEQSNFAWALKMFAHKYNFVLLCVLHTGAQIRRNHNTLIDDNDVRGMKAIVNISQFFYISQQFEVGTVKYQTLRVTKHRGQDLKNNQAMWLLTYVPQGRIYASDKPVQFERFKEIFKNRNKLSS